MNRNRTGRRVPLEHITQRELLISLHRTVVANAQKVIDAADDEMLLMHAADLQRAAFALEQARAGHILAVVDTMWHQDTGARDVWLDTLPEKYVAI